MGGRTGPSFVLSSLSSGDPPVFQERESSGAVHPRGAVGNKRAGSSVPQRGSGGAAGGVKLRASRGQTNGRKGYIGS
ncbi:MAG: hypothetical protein QW175_03200 [Candidatus Bathyarchaeia archaeon]